MLEFGLLELDQVGRWIRRYLSVGGGALAGSDDPLNKVGLIPETIGQALLVFCKLFCLKHAVFVKLRNRFIISCQI